MASFGYTYDDNKNKLTETLGAPMADYGFDSTTYDNEDRLTAWSRVDDNKDQEWELSAAGDWESFTEEAVEVERTHNDVHELTAVGATNLTYDAKGNLPKDGAQTYAKYIWDFDNRLQAVDTDDDDTSEVFYTYDALGRRITKSIVVLSGYGGSSSSSGISRRSAGGRSITRRGASTTVTTTTIFVPDGQQEVAEYTYVSTVGTPNLTKKYVYAAYIDEPVLMLNVDGETETKYYYHQNSLYSVGALTDQSGTVVERYSYLAYGAITFHDADGSVAASQESTVANPYLFTGRRLDPETSLQYSRARYYHFTLGRWISRDPIGFAAEDMNLYRYVGNNPLIYADSLGLAWVLVNPPDAETPDNGSDDIDINNIEITPPNYGLESEDDNDLSSSILKGTSLRCCDGILYDSNTHCCENDKIVKKVIVHVINRSKGKRTGLTEGHIDLLIPGCGMVGYYGVDNGRTIGPTDEIPGNVNISPFDWKYGDTKRPLYTIGRGTARQPGYLSTICDISVCPGAAGNMCKKARALKASPGKFRGAGNNCASQGCNILAAGGITNGEIPGIDSPQSLIDLVKANYGAKCYNGYTKLDTNNGDVKWSIVKDK